MTDNRMGTSNAIQNKTSHIILSKSITNHFWTHKGH